MNVLLLWDSFPPEVGGGAAGGYAMAKHLARMGHRVHVVTKKHPSMMASASPEDYPVPLGCTVHYELGMSLPALFPGSGYVPAFARRALRICRDHAIDVIHGSSPTIGCALSGRIAGEVTGKPFVFGIRDPWVRVPVESFDPGRSHAYVHPNTPGGRARMLLERWIGQGADAIVVTNPSIRSEFLALHPETSPGRVHVVYNGADLEEFEGVEPKRFDRFTVFYSGVLYKDRGIRAMIEAVSGLKDAQLLLTGMGPPDEMGEFRRLFRAHPNVRHLGMLPRRELAACLLGADVLYVSLGTWPMNRYLLPSKLFAYMAAGRPVLATGLPGGDLEAILRSTDCGLFVPSEDPETIAAALACLRDSGLAKRLGENGRRAVEQKFNREVQARSLAEIYRSIIETA